ncbi:MULTISPECIES: creatininase family protein [Halorussus]|uniref:creatininase family protein n=1 Tax=Halorussus TaxID=1070314 RepID=UPI00209E4F5C|nr:creatininase family protein [Halorussus vallis]USZ78297.1 creatininase family protein [Halorussus vallis]
MLPTGRSSSVAWATKTRREIRKTGTADGSVVVVPVGSIEQHGHHLPVATDTLLVDAVAHHGAERATDDVPILVTPPVWSGFSPHHASLGGTLTLELEDLLAVLEDIADSALDNGFDGVCFINGHGGNAAIIDNVVSTVGKTHPETEVTGLTYFELAESFADEIRESDVGGMAHGGEFETSLMLHLHADLVTMDEADAEYLDEPYDRGTKDLLVGGALSTYRPFEEYSTSGAIGDPSLASAVKGAELFDRLGDELADVLRAVSEQSQ